MSRAAVLVSLLLAGGCAHVTPGPSDATFDQLVEAVLGRWFAAHPIDATQLGVHAHDGAMPALDTGARNRRAAEIERDLSLLDETGPLTPTRVLDRRVLDHALRAELLELRVVNGWQNNPMGYASLLANGAASLVDRTFAPTDKRVADLVARFGQFSRVIRDARANLRNPPKLWTEIAIKSARGTVSFLEKDLPAALSTQGLAHVDAGLKVRFGAAHRQAVDDVSGFADWLEQDLLPRSAGNPRLGKETFETKLRYEEHFSLSVEELERMNEAAIARYHEWVTAEAKKVDPNKSPREIMALIAAEHPSADGLIATAARYVEEARAFVVAKDLVTLPTAPTPIIRESPAYARRGFASMSASGPFEPAATESYYNITNVDPAWNDAQQEQHLTYFNHPGLLGISIHEVMPGHFVQLARQAEATPVRRVFCPASFIEGWAHYAEQMMLDEGLRDGDPKIRLGQLRRALQRHARWAAAIAIHVHGESVEEVAKRFEEIAFFAPFPALRETQRATYNPTYLYYALGRMEILSLREAVRAKQGAQFSLRGFHDRLLELGLPIPLAREVMLD